MTYVSVHSIPVCVGVVATGKGDIARQADRLWLAFCLVKTVLVPAQVGRVFASTFKARHQILPRVLYHSGYQEEEAFGQP